MTGYNSTSSGNTHDQAEPAEGAPSAPGTGKSATNAPATRPAEFGGRRKGLEPTRYGDWEKEGRCIDF